MELKFKWRPGDVVTLGDEYYIILGTSEIEDRQRYPKYIGKLFGVSKSGRFVGYHTKAFQDKRRRTFEGELWFEGMQYLWDVSKLDPDKLAGPKKIAYETAIQGVKFLHENYQRSQIIFIFKETKKRI